MGIDDPIGPLVDTEYIAKDWSRTKRTLRNWRAAGIFPEPDCVINGQSFWRRETYLKWKQDALAGRFAGQARIANITEAKSRGR